MRETTRFLLLFLSAVTAMGVSYGAGFLSAERLAAARSAPLASFDVAAVVSSLPDELRARAGVGSTAAPDADEGDAAAADPGESGSDLGASSVEISPEADGFGIFWETLQAVRSRHVGEPLGDDEATYGAIRGSLRSLDDPFTLFSDPVDTAVSQPELEGQFEGIGAYVTTNEDGLLMIQTPMRGQPAEKAGVRAGDVVIKVDDRDITDMEVNDSVLLIRGPKGTTVTLTILREGEPDPIEIAVVRDRIDIPSVTNVKTLDALGAPQVGYLAVTVFAAETRDELVDAIEQLDASGAEAIILDLRNNPGGYLSAAIDVVSQFIAEGVVVQQEDSSGRRVAMEAEGGGAALDVPLVVLVNKGSASASEIVAGAIQDLGRGLLVGEQTFGKGSVQNVHELSDKSQLRVTVAAWLTPSGKLIHLEGITPDIVVAPPARPTPEPTSESATPTPSPTPTPTAAPETDEDPALDGGASQADDVQLIRAIEEALRLLQDR